MDLHELVYIVRILVAGVCGMVIGFERKNRLKEAGIRTHCLVASGAALMMVLSKYGFSDMTVADGLRGADPARIAAQVVSGIGFLGAGMIFVHKNTITGLTTAAGIWATAGIGMAIGAGMYITGIASTVIVVIAQTILHINSKVLRHPTVRRIIIYDVDEDGYQSKIEKRLNENGITVHGMSVRKNNENSKKIYKMFAELPPTLDEEKVSSLIEYKCEVKTVN